MPLIHAINLCTPIVTSKARRRLYYHYSIETDGGPGQTSIDVAIQVSQAPMANSLKAALRQKLDRVDGGGPAKGSKN